MNVLKNGKYQIEVSSIGAELKSFSCKNVEYLHAGDQTYWHRSSPVLFPIVGRVKHNNYTYKDKKYTLPIHGFARFYKFKLIEKSTHALLFLLQENQETLKHYPFKFNLKIKYTLHKDGLKIDYSVYSDEDILFSFGAHPAFLLHASIDDSYIEFEKDEHSDTICLNMKTGCVSPKIKKILNSSRLSLHHDIFAKDALIFKNLNSKEIIFKNTRNTKCVKVAYAGFTYLAFWAPVGAPFVCIEPWCGIADSIDTSHKFESKASIIKLDKNTLFERSLRISLY